MSKPTPCVHYHKGGTMRARGFMLAGQMSGHWEFFRLDGTLMRSGAFDHGVQVSEWTTYDRAGKPHKVTRFPTAAPAAEPSPAQSTRTR
jgi:antitoxin component YwqK of YwqJK toxin-antitoxin module